MKNNGTILVGFLLWLSIAFWLFPASLFELNYVQILLLAAPLWLIPLVLQQDRFSQIFRLVALFCAAVLAGSFLLPQGVFSAILTIPWLVFTGNIGLKKLMELIDYQDFNYPKFVNAFAYIFLPIGAIWAFCDRLNFQPFGFDSTMVLLTAVHFHYAGFLLLILTSQILDGYPRGIQKIVSGGVILGVPLVAIGISTTHFTFPVFIETLCVTVMAFSGFVVGILLQKTGWENRKYLFGWLWILAGLALSGGMVLAFLYGWRHYFPFSFLSIPWMYAVHGTLNAVGFAAPGVLGGFLAQQKKDLYLKTHRIES